MTSKYSTTLSWWRSLSGISPMVGKSLGLSDKRNVFGPSSDCSLASTCIETGDVIGTILDLLSLSMSVARVNRLLELLM